MDPGMSDAEAVRELDQVRHALAAAQLLVTGLDHVTTALEATGANLDRESGIRYSGLHSRLDLALEVLDRITTSLRARHR